MLREEECCRSGSGLCLSVIRLLCLGVMVYVGDRYVMQSSMWVVSREVERILSEALGEVRSMISVEWWALTVCSLFGCERMRCEDERVVYVVGRDPRGSGGVVWLEEKCEGLREDSVELVSLFRVDWESRERGVTWCVTDRDKERGRVVVERYQLRAPRDCCRSGGLYGARDVSVCGGVRVVSVERKVGSFWRALTVDAEIRSSGCIGDSAEMSGVGEDVNMLLRKNCGLRECERDGARRQCAMIDKMYAGEFAFVFGIVGWGCWGVSVDVRSGGRERRRRYVLSELGRCYRVLVRGGGCLAARELRGVVVGRDGVVCRSGSERARLVDKVRVRVIEDRVRRALKEMFVELSRKFSVVVECGDWDDSHKVDVESGGCRGCGCMDECGGGWAQGGGVGFGGLWRGVLCGGGWGWVVWEQWGVNGGRWEGCGGGCVGDRGGVGGGGSVDGLGIGEMCVEIGEMGRRDGRSELRVEGRNGLRGIDKVGYYVVIIIVDVIFAFGGEYGRAVVREVRLETYLARARRERLMVIGMVYVEVVCVVSSVGVRECWLRDFDGGERVENRESDVGVEMRRDELVKSSCREVLARGAQTFGDVVSVLLRGAGVDVRSDSSFRPVVCVVPCVCCCGCVCRWRVVTESPERDARWIETELKEGGESGGGVGLGEVLEWAVYVVWHDEVDYSHFGASWFARRRCCGEEAVLCKACKKRAERVSRRGGVGVRFRYLCSSWLQGRGEREGCVLLSRVEGEGDLRKFVQVARLEGGGLGEWD
ncbi:hypothetical protein Tco_0876452 [Tanacetum coccineum]|uniref:Uncharacterized protein n=1 Tax=Tanacetum coccineum TaxID=301880 RepID=A0ABQ5BV36_9ASTR